MSYVVVWNKKRVVRKKSLNTFSLAANILKLRSIGKIAAHSAYEMFSWYKYLIVSLVFSHLGFWSGNLSLIAPFPDLCLFVLFHWQSEQKLFVTQLKPVGLKNNYYRPLFCKWKRNNNKKL